MIGAIPTSGIFAPSLTINNVVQDVNTAIVTISTGTGASITDYEFQTSTDEVTWTDRGDSLVLGSRVVDFIDTPLYYRGRVVAGGAFGEWSNNFLFNSTLITTAPAAPNSVTVTAVTRFSGFYRIAFTVNQPSAAPSGSNRGIYVEYEYGSGGIGFINNGFSFISSTWLSGNNSYSVDAPIAELADFKVRLNVYNSAGGYDSAEVTSDVFPETIPNQDEVQEFYTTSNITVPVWATNFDYWLIGGAGGGGSGKVTSVGNVEANSLYYAGEPGQAATLMTGNLSLPISDLNVVRGIGGIGANQVLQEFSTAGADSVLRSDTTPLVTSTGGAGGANDTYVPFASPPSAGNGSATVNIDTETFLGNAGLPPREDANFPNPVDSINSQYVVGGPGGGYAWPDAGLADGITEVFSGGSGGSGYLRIKFKNY